MTQLALPFETRAALGRADFLVTGANRDAVAWLDRWPDWPGHVLALYGPEGCGKSHLVQVLAARTDARVLDAAALPAATALGAPPAVLAVEDGPPPMDAEAALFHLINWTREHRTSLLLTGRAAPAQWPVRLPDLRSRLAAVTAVGISLPDEALLAAILVKLFADRQLAIEPKLIDFIVPRMERSFAAAQTLTAALDQAALAAGSRVTIALARRILSEIARNLS